MKVVTVTGDRITIFTNKTGSVFAYFECEQGNKVCLVRSMEIDLMENALYVDYCEGNREYSSFFQIENITIEKTS